MLKIEFLESGKGETIVITFPNGKIGIVDAHPSACDTRPDISEIVKDKNICFACLTHPHADHGVDLTKLFEDPQCQVQAFWHTLTQVDQFFYGLKEIQNYPGKHRELIREQREKWAEFLIDLYYAVRQRKVPERQLRNDMRGIVIGDVEVIVLSPTQEVQNSFVSAYQELLENKSANIPDPNLLSAILALRYGDSVALLGGDALRKNWNDAAKLFREIELPKANVFKVPHHGAKNALRVKPVRHQSNYFSLCSHSPKAIAVVFPGDTKHPHPSVLAQLQSKTELHEVGISRNITPENPLRLGIPGACSVASGGQGTPVVTVEISKDGNLVVREDNAAAQ